MTSPWAVLVRSLAKSKLRDIHVGEERSIAILPHPLNSGPSICQKLDCATSPWKDSKVLFVQQIGSDVRINAKGDPV